MGLIRYFELACCCTPDETDMHLQTRRDVKSHRDVSKWRRRNWVQRAFRAEIIRRNKRCCRREKSYLRHYRSLCIYQYWNEPNYFRLALVSKMFAFISIWTYFSIVYRSSVPPRVSTDLYNGKFVQSFTFSQSWKATTRTGFSDSRRLASQKISWKATGPRALLSERVARTGRSP